jgi:hypothetical protein
MGQYWRVSESGSRGGDVLAGPRGRELYACLATGMTVMETELDAVAALADVAERASYWGEPAVPIEHSAAELRAVALRLAESGGCQWSARRPRC